MGEIDQEAVRERMDRIYRIFSGMAQHADEQALMRCPYKDRFNECTAKFGCRYQRKATAGRERLRCASDDTLDYRSAWETDPESVEQTRKTIRRQKTTRESGDRAASVRQQKDRGNGDDIA